MVKRRKNKPESRLKFRQNKLSPKKRAWKSSPFSGLGRYIIGAVVMMCVVRFLFMPLADRLKSHPVFTVRSVVVEGVDYIDREEIITTAAVQKGKNIFEINLEKISGALLDAFAAEDFTVYRRLPDTITIRVNERQPVALLNMKTLVGVDADGVPLPHVGASLIETLPIITGIKSVSSLSDSTVKARLITGLKLLDRISRESPPVYNKISEVNISTMADMGITLIGSGLEVIIGDENWGQNLPNLEKVISKVTERIETVKVVDIRFGEKIFVRKK
ncbi:cell division protein FtsQ/DivIB [Candidatus Latescibacterota bacterium]